MVEPVATEAPPEDTGIVKYEIERTEGTYRITVPAAWRVTYGLLHPGSKDRYGQEGYVLRIYETDTKQRAVFTNVLSFRDLSIETERKVLNINGKREYASSSTTRKESSEQNVEVAWEPVN